VRTRLLVLTLLALAVLAAIDGWRLLAARRVNAAVAAGDEDRLRRLASPHARFALASQLAERGDWQGALSLYQEIEERGPSTLHGTARYNRAQLYHRLGLEASGRQDAHSQPLFELAKQHYRELLAREPGHWDGRYNLERILRLAPDAPEDDSEAANAPIPSERAVTTMRGFTLGLP